MVFRAISCVILFGTVCFGQDLDSRSQMSAIPIDSLWTELVFEKGGCLTGGQYVVDGHFGGQACVMSDYFRRGKKWKTFFEVDEAELTNFLISKLSDTTTTRIHTCPCYEASNGEVAVYALQNIYKKNWFDFSEFELYKNREMTDCDDSRQSWLKTILSSEKQCAIMVERWKKE